MTIRSMRALWLAAAAAAMLPPSALCTPQVDPQAPGNVLARSIFAELVNINTTHSAGASTPAAEAMARRFRDAGFPAADIQVFGPNDKKKNLLVRLRGRGRHKPLLLIGHLDTVEATRSEWSSDPFAFTEKDGFFYGRGTIDMKNGDAVMVASLLRLKASGARPARDIILALTADEEMGDANGVAWLFKEHRDLVDAELALNMDDYSVVASRGVPKYYQMEAAEKIYADFQLLVTSPGGHSSLPGPDNAIYTLANALQRLGGHAFPFELNSITRSYYERTAAIESGERAADIRAILTDPPSPEAIARLSKNRMDNAAVRTTCVATRLQGGDENNSLPQRAESVVNCRILPGHSPEEVRQDLVRIVADPAISVKFLDYDGSPRDTAPSRKGLMPPPLNPAVMQPLQALVHRYWPDLQVIPDQAAGGSDGIIVSNAGIPVYLITGFQCDIEDDRFHARDERIGVATFYSGNEFFYEFLRQITAR